MRNVNLHHLVKIQQKTIGIEEKWVVINWHDKDEWIVDLCSTVGFIRSIVRTFCDKSDRIAESAKSETKVLRVFV
jgi:hypothetical protein